MGGSHPLTRRCHNYYGTTSMNTAYQHVALVAGTLLFAAAFAQAGATVCFEAESATTLTAPMRW